MKQYQGPELIKLSFAMYVDSEAFLVKTSSCQNNPEIYHMSEINNHIGFGFLLLQYLQMISLKIKNIFIVHQIATLNFSKS